MGAQDSTPRRAGSPCIWVSAGLIAFYLCDRDFDCDHCPLHHALTRSARRSIHGIADWPDACRYTPGHLWVKRLADDSVRVGITPFGAELLNPVEKWEPSSSAQIGANDPLVTAHTVAGPVSLRLPFDGRVESYNPWLSTDPLWPLADPWESGFFADLHVRSWRDIRAACPDLEGLKPQLRRQKQQVGLALVNAHWTERPATRAADGGVPFGGLATALGVPAYRALLARIFCP